tara:strand:- start:98 stop:388 length:291 start_codon:yes stop_codon:yes gene_type:complete
MIPKTLKNSGTVISPLIEPRLMMAIQTTAKFMSPTTSSVLNNANNLGNAEVLEPAREEDGAQDMMDAPRPHSQSKPQDFSLITDLFRNLDLDYAAK